MPDTAVSSPSLTDGTGPSLVEAVHACKPFAKRLKPPSRKTTAAAGTTAPTVLDHVAREAFPFASALAAKAFPKKRLWLLCPDARTQEQIHAELHIWGVPSLFFPRQALVDTKGSLSDPETQAERVTVLSRFAEGADQPRVLILTAESLEEEVATLHELESAKKPLHTGMKLDVEALLQELESSGYERVPTVSERGQYARRGGIVDVFSWQGEEPLRMEFFDDELESLRSFDVHSQTSVQRFERVSLLLHQLDANAGTTRLSSLATEDDAVIAIESAAESLSSLFCRTALITSGAASGDATEDFSTAVFENPLGMFEAGDFVLHEARRSQFTKQVSEWRTEKWRIVMFLHNEAERERFLELAGADWIAQQNIELTLGLLHRGFVVPSAKLAVLTGAEIFGRHMHTRRIRGSKLDEAQVLRQARDHLREMRHGDLVVHADYGIGKFAGIQVREGVQ